MKTTVALGALTLIGISCAPTPPTQPVLETAVSSPSAADALAPGAETPGSAAGIFVDPPDTLASSVESLATTMAHVIPDPEPAQLFHSADFESRLSPLPVAPEDPTQPESVAAYVVAVWAIESLEGESWAEVASDWITPGLAATGRSVAPVEASTSTSSAIVSAELFESEFETRVVVTVERSDPRTGAFSVFVVEVLLVPTVSGWVVAALEFAR